MRTTKILDRDSLFAEYTILKTVSRFLLFFCMGVEVLPAENNDLNKISFFKVASDVVLQLISDV